MEVSVVLKNIGGIIVSNPIGSIKSKSEEKILELAIQKAIDGGWIEDYQKLDYIPDYRPGVRVIYWNKDGLRTTKLFESPEQLIFNHNFAKALWGEAPRVISRYVEENGNQRQGEVITDWQYHLQQMVIAKDPIKYLGEHI